MEFVKCIAISPAFVVLDHAAEVDLDGIKGFKLFKNLLSWNEIQQKWSSLVMQNWKKTFDLPHPDDCAPRKKES